MASNGKLNKIAPLGFYLVEYTDGFGKTDTRCAIVLPGGDVRFLESNAIGKPAQKWLADQITDTIKGNAQPAVEEESL